MTYRNQYNKRDSEQADMPLHTEQSPGYFKMGRPQHSDVYKRQNQSCKVDFNTANRKVIFIEGGNIKNPPSLFHQYNSGINVQGAKCLKPCYIYFFKIVIEK